MGRWWRWAAAGLGVAAVAGCAADEGVGEGEAAVAIAPAIVPLDARVWVDSSYAQFRAASEDVTQPLPPAISDDDPLAVKVAGLVTRVDTLVRAEAAKAGRSLNAPAPVVKVLRSNGTFNAWVSGVPVCLGAPLVAPDAETTAYVARGQVTAYPKLSCLRPGWPLADTVRYWNASRPACALAVAGGALQVSGEACQVDQGFQAGDTFIVATGRAIQFSTDLLAELDEWALTVVAVHELGHYYMGHPVDAEAAKFSFWYNAAGAARGVPRPTTAGVASELEAVYREVVQRQAPPGGPGLASKFSPRLRPFLLSGLAPLLAERTEAGFPCAAARDALGEWTSELLLESAPSPASREAFLSFEAKLAACAPNLRLAGSAPSEISAGVVLRAAGAFRPGAKARVIMVPGDSLGAFLARLDGEARTLDAKAQRLATRVHQNAVGLYTPEQAADDFALATAMKLGMTSDEVLSGWVSFMRATDRTFQRVYGDSWQDQFLGQEGYVDTDRCEAMLRDGFKSAGAGGAAPVLMSIGDFQDTHHTSCYRLFNLWRHVGAYTPPTRKPAADWDALRARAAQLSADAP